jgi:hypothetical protein
MHILVASEEEGWVTRICCRSHATNALQDPRVLGELSRTKKRCRERERVRRHPRGGPLPASLSPEHSES